MRICILGATGLVGRETLRLVARAWPDAELALFASRDQTLEHDGKSYPVKAATSLEDADAPKGDLALVALDDDFSRRYCPRLVELGYRVVDKSNTYRMDPKVPLAVGGVNTHEVTDAVNLVANPNCTTIPFTLAVAPLSRKWGLTSVSVSSYQAISGAGISALRDFQSDAREGYARDDQFGTAFDPARYAANVVPHNGKTDDSGFSSEERKLMNESRKILGQADLPVCAQCCRVPVAVGHYENTWITLGEAIGVGDLASVYETAPFVKFFPGADGAGLTSLATVHDRDNALVGRFRKDPRDASGKTWCMTVAADNLRLGAATNAVRVASRWFASKDPLLQSPG